MDWMSTPQGAATFVVLMLLVLGVVFIVMTAAGGALGASYGWQAAGIPMITRRRACDHNPSGKGCSSACAFRMMRAA